MASSSAERAEDLPLKGADGMDFQEAGATEEELLGKNWQAEFEKAQAVNGELEEQQEELHEQIRQLQEQLQQQDQLHQSLDGNTAQYVTELRGRTRALEAKLDLAQKESKDATMKLKMLDEQLKQKEHQIQKMALIETANSYSRADWGRKCDLRESVRQLQSQGTRYRYDKGCMIRQKADVDSKKHRKINWKIPQAIPNRRNDQGCQDGLPWSKLRVDGKGEEFGGKLIGVKDGSKGCCTDGSVRGKVRMKPRSSVRRRGRSRKRGYHREDRRGVPRDYIDNYSFYNSCHHGFNIDLESTFTCSPNPIKSPLPIPRHVGKTTFP